MDNISKNYYATARARAAGSDLARFLRQLGTQVPAGSSPSASTLRVEFFYFRTILKDKV